MRKLNKIVLKFFYVFLISFIISGCAQETNDLTEKLSSPNQVSLVAPENTISAQQSLHDDSKDCIKAIEDFDWGGYENKPFLNEFAEGAEATVTIVDINQDGKNEIILSTWGSSSMLVVSEVFSIIENETISIGGFYGFINMLGLGDTQSRAEGISLYKNIEGDRVFIQQVELSSGGLSKSILLETKVADFGQTPVFSKVEPYCDGDIYADGFQYFQYFDHYQIVSADDIRNIIDKTLDIKKGALLIEKYEKELEKYLTQLVPIGVISFETVGSYFISTPDEIGHEISECYK